MTLDRADFEEKLDGVLRQRLPGCQRLISAERLSGGASQETYRIFIDTRDGERRICLRRSPGGISLEDHPTSPGLAAEAQLMRAARAAGVPEPEVYYVLQPGDALGEGFFMEWLDGETLGARIARSPELADIRPKLAHECGRILGRIHGIDVAAAGVEDRLQRYTPETFVRQMWERYQAFETAQPMIDYSARWLLEHLPQDPRTTLVHNDFRNGNFMVDGSGINAVLDWEVAHIGDPMRDLGWICTNSWRFGVTEKPVGGFGDYADLFAGYEAETGLTVDPDHVRFWEVFGSFWWAIGCLGMAEHYRNGPDQTVERPGIGRRSSECQVDCVNLLIPGPVELVEPRDLGADDGMPRLDELVVSVRDFLRGDVMSATDGRVNFLARVAGNSLDIVLRELASGEAHRAGELERLRALMGADAPLTELRWRLTRALRDGTMALDATGLAEHLRTTVVNQVAMDQPRYTGLKTALANAGH